MDRRGFLGGLIAAAAARGIVVGDTAGTPLVTPAAPEPEYDIVYDYVPMTYGGRDLGGAMRRATKVLRKKCLA